VGARHAERVTFTLGAAPDRIDWAVDAARKASAAAGRSLPSLGAYVIVAVHPDVAVAREMVRGNVGIFALFLRTQATLGRLTVPDRQVVENVNPSYERVRHGFSKPRTPRP
jgi:5,10-methylenetetrahydromethanopterin reductase